MFRILKEKQWSIVYCKAIDHLCRIFYTNEIHSISLHITPSSPWKCFSPAIKPFEICVGLIRKILDRNFIERLVCWGFHALCTIYYSVSICVMSVFSDPLAIYEMSSLVQCSPFFLWQSIPLPPHRPIPVSYICLHDL